MSKGTAMNCWAPYAGQIPLIVQSGCFTADDRIIETVTDPEECVRLGADAIAIAIGIFGPNEGRFIKMLMDQVTRAAKFDLPVIAHIYPRDFSGPSPKITFDPEGIMWAARIGIEAGVDVIKVGYTGDVNSFRQVVESSPVPVVAAGGPKEKPSGIALRDGGSRPGRWPRRDHWTKCVGCLQNHRSGQGVQSRPLGRQEC